MLFPTVKVVLIWLFVTPLWNTVLHCGTVQPTQVQLTSSCMMSWG